MTLIPGHTSDTMDGSAIVCEVNGQGHLYVNHRLVKTTDLKAVKPEQRMFERLDMWFDPG